SASTWTTWTGRGCQASTRPADLGGRRFQQHLDGAGAARVLQRLDGLFPAIKREAMRDHRRQVEPGGDEVEIVLHRVLGHSADFLDAESVRPDDVQFLEIQRRPFKSLRRLDA